VVRDQDIPSEGRMVQCGYCSRTWHQMPNIIKLTKVKKQEITNKTINDSPSVDSMKASDGKTYKFLGSQWAELLPSGKTGLFARKKISKELDQITGRKTKKSKKRKQQKNLTVDPSKERLPEIYKPKQSMGFFGYVFLLIIIGFSLVGILKTFENDLINYFPEIEYFFELLDEQLEYVAESIKNMIVLIIDLMNSY
tara:strand:+ start:165 stop:752 length:588 start_codon:yes stop_codon:yes gene_type:complete